MKGWECPKCGRCYSPFVTDCSACNTPQVDLTTTITPIQVPLSCTCGMTSNLPCRIHGGVCSSAIRDTTTIGEERDAWLRRSEFRKCARVR